VANLPAWALSSSKSSHWVPEDVLIVDLSYAGPSCTDPCYVHYSCTRPVRTLHGWPALRRHASRARVLPAPTRVDVRCPAWPLPWLAAPCLLPPTPGPACVDLFHWASFLIPEEFLALVSIVCQGLCPATEDCSRDDALIDSVTKDVRYEAIYFLF
jgi:hypothetical protein